MNKELIAISHELGHGGDLYTTPLDALRGPSQQQLEFLPDIIEEYERRHPVDAGETSACSCYGHAPRILPFQRAHDDLQNVLSFFKLDY